MLRQHRLLGLRPRSLQHRVAAAVLLRLLSPQARHLHPQPRNPPRRLPRKPNRQQNVHPPKHLPGPLRPAGLGGVANNYGCLCMEPSDLRSQRRDQDGGLPAQPQWDQDVRAFWNLRHPLQYKIMGRVDVDSGHLQTQSADMSAKRSDADSGLSGGICGQHHADPDQPMPRSLWAALVARVGNFRQYLRQVGNQSDQSSQSRQPAESSEPHSCVNLPARACYCPNGVCADDPATYRYAVLRPPSGESGRVRTPEPNQLGNFRCPISGLACSKYACREWCESGVDYTKT